MTDSSIYQRPAELLQYLIRFDTTNPPGNEREAIEYLVGLLQAVGLSSQCYGRTPERPNLVVRLKGRGESPPLLVYGHVDVVTTVGQEWAHDPFGGELIDGFVWGRGALDMKGAVAMMVSAVMHMAAEEIVPPGDVILAVVADEENFGKFGARFLVEEHPELFEGVNYALGEFGGFNLDVAGKTFYPIQVSEKQVVGVRATITGPGGHGAMFHQCGAMAKLGRFLSVLDQALLPITLTPPTRLMLEGLSSNAGFSAGAVLSQLMNPALAPMVLRLLGKQGELFSPLLRNTVNATIVHGGEKRNVIPSEIVVELDGRILPGLTPDVLLAELSELVGDDIHFEAFEHDPGPASVDMGLFGVLADILKEADPVGVPVPLVLSGVTDGRFFAQLGIQTYGFTPMQLPKDMNFTGLVHAADERVPVAAIEFGTAAIFKALQRF